MTKLPTYDFTLINRIEEGLKKCVGKRKAAKSTFMVKKLKQEGFEKVSPSKIREVVHYLRTKRNMIICGDNAGYYLPATNDEFKHQITTMQSRIREISEACNAMIKSHSNNSQQQTIAL